MKGTRTRIKAVHYLKDSDHTSILYYPQVKGWLFWRDLPTSITQYGVEKFGALPLSLAEAVIEEYNSEYPKTEVYYIQDKVVPNTSPEDWL